MPVARKNTSLFALTALCLSIGLVLWAAGQASAASGGHVFQSEFGSTGTLAGQLASPVGIAIDQSNHDVYVADTGNFRIDKFDSAGSFLLMFGKGVNAGTGNPDVCTNAGPPANVCQAGTSGAEPGQFSNPRGVAVDSSGGPSNGDVYVSDASPNSVQKFTSGGAYIGNINPPAGSFGTMPEHGGVAIDGNGDLWVLSDQTDDVYEFDSGGNFVGGSQFNDTYGTSVSLSVNGPGTRVYTSRGSGEIDSWDVTTGHTPEHGVDSFTIASGLSSAVDPVDGSVYAVNSGSVQQYSPSGTEIGPAFTGPNNSNAAIRGTDSFAYVTGGDKVTVFEPIIIPNVALSAVTNPTPTSGTLNGSIDPAGGGNITECYFEYGESPAYGETKPCSGSPPYTSPTSVSADLSGLTMETTYHYRLVAVNTNGSNATADATYTPHAVPGLNTDPADQIGPQSARLNGSWVGNGEDTHFYFEWGTSTAYEHLTAAPPGEDGHSALNTTVHFPLTGLEPVTTYHYRIVASNGKGTSHGDDQSFKTLPSEPVVSVFVTDVHGDSAILHAIINPGGGSTHYHFEYGTDTTYGTIEPEPDASLASVTGNQEVSLQVTGLSAGTTYHFRAVAENVTGTTDSNDHTFITFPYSPAISDPCPNAHVRQQTGAALLLDCRAYELVSAANSGGYDVESDLVPGGMPYGGYPQATSPPRVLYAVHGGGIPGSGDPTNRGPDPYVATRGSDGWTTKYVGIPASGTPSALPFSSTVAGASADLSAFAFGGPEICAPCFADGTAGIPVRMPDGSLVQGMAGSESPVGATPAGFIGKQLSANGTHLIFGSKSKFEEDGNSNGDISIYDRNLTAGVTHVVSKTPAGATMTGSGIGELDVSGDGSRIVIGQLVSTDSSGNRYWHLYMNLGDSTHTVDLTPGTTSGALYDGMTADGSKVFFSTPENLLGNDTDASVDIYEADVAPNGSVTLSRVSTGSGGTGDSDGCDPALNSDRPHWNTVGVSLNCNAVAIGGGGGVASGDGSIYFLSPEKLDGGGNGVQDQPNLYVLRPGAPGPHFVATLEPDNRAVLNALGDSASRHFGDFQLTPSGDFAAFVSNLPVTGFDNDGHNEVYRYDAQGDALACASCAPTNVAATGDAAMASGGLSLTNDGRVFFTSGEPLAPRDLDGKKDAYEWENGQTQLISSGTSPFDSGLLSVSADGTDAYFFTHDVLAPQDENGPLTKIYDARENGGFFVSPPPPPCVASDECHGPGTAAPAQPSIGTEAGRAGNVVHRKRHHKKHHKKRHHHKKGHRRAHRHG